MKKPFEKDFVPESVAKKKRRFWWLVVGVFFTVCLIWIGSLLLSSETGEKNFESQMLNQAREETSSLLIQLEKSRDALKSLLRVIK